MSAMERLRGSSGALADKLTARELEILRLLTVGHTVKSIAVRLGRSEASINERLRDARRKTGAGNMPFIDSGSLRQPAPGTLVMTLGKNGAPVSTRVYTASRDRKSMTETIIWAGQAMPKLETNLFRRIG